MIKYLIVILLSTTLCIQEVFAYNGSTTAAVTIAGSVIRAKNYQPENQKYKRKDCPVCKGKGWYMSGDGIEKIPCQYCEPETTLEAQPKTSTIIRRR